MFSGLNPLAPTVAPYGGFGAYPGYEGGLEAWGTPIYRKKWLFGKYRYAGLKNVRYVPTAAPMATVAPMATACAPIATACAPAVATACAPTLATGCATPMVGAPLMGGCY